MVPNELVSRLIYLSILKGKIMENFVNHVCYSIDKQRHDLATAVNAQVQINDVFAKRLNHLRSTDLMLGLALASACLLFFIQDREIKELQKRTKGTTGK